MQIQKDCTKKIREKNNPSKYVWKKTAGKICAYVYFKNQQNYDVQFKPIKSKLKMPFSTAIKIQPLSKRNTLFKSI